jgi:hypothetical protein
VGLVARREKGCYKLSPSARPIKCNGFCVDIIVRKAIMNNIVRGQNMTIIHDQTIELDEETDLFGTLTYVSALEEAIVNHEGPDPHTIGLFGGWGTGKSSIVKTLANRLRGLKEIRVMTYDAWKYSHDAFRRSFILEMQRQLGLEAMPEFERLYRDQSKEIDHKVKVKKFPAWLTIPLSAITIAYVILVLLSSASETEKLLGVIAGTIIPVLAILLREPFVVYKVTVKEERLFSPEQFEEIFKEGIAHLCHPGSPKARWFTGATIASRHVNRVVIVVDNIDRCHAEMAVELLSAIKTFLEIDCCTFIVPVDDKAIREKLKDNCPDTEEFLRKFFDLTVRMRLHSTDQLFNFTQRLIATHQLGFPAKVASIVSQEFSKNPRRIIRFLNNLTAECEIAKAQEDLGHLKPGSVTQNVDYLAKILLIREEWPDLYETISRSPHVLKEIDNEVKTGARNASLSEDSSKIGILSDCQRWFFYRTQLITSATPGRFLRLQDVERGVPEEAIEAIEGGDLQFVKDFLEKGAISMEVIWSVISRRLDTAITQRGLVESEGFPMLSFALSLTGDTQIGTEARKYEGELQRYLVDGKVARLYHKFGTSDLIDYVKRRCKSGHRGLCDSLVAFLDGEQKCPELIKKYAIAFGDDLCALRSIQNAFSKSLELGTLDIEDEDIWKILQGDGVPAALISPSLGANLMKKINESPTGSGKAMVIIRRLSKFGVINRDVRAQYINKAVSLSHDGDWPKRFFWVDSIEGMIDSETLGSSPTPDVGPLFDPLVMCWNLVQQGRTSPAMCDFASAVIRVMGDACIAHNGNAPKALEAIRHWYRVNYKPLLIAAIQSYQKIVKGLPSSAWTFADEVVSYVPHLQDSESRLEAALLCAEMIKRTVKSGDRWFGVQIDGCKQTLDFLLKAFKDGNSRIDDALAEIVRHPLGREAFQNLAPTMDKNVIRNTLPSLSKAEVLGIDQTMANALLQWKGNKEEMTQDINLVQKLANGRELAANSLEIALEKSQVRDLNSYKGLLSLSVEQQDLFSETRIVKLIDNKIFPLLSGEYPEADFGVDLLLGLKEIPQENRETLIPLLKRMKSVTPAEKSDDFKKKLTQLEKRLRRA